MVASNRGGLTESVGPGGMLIDTGASVEEWVTCVRRLWNDKLLHAKMSAAAVQYSQRAQLNSNSQVEQLIELAERAISMSK